MKLFLAHSSNFDFRNKLYAPLRCSALNSQHEILLPQESEKEEITRDMIKSCDAVVADVSAPSLGAGIEMGWADAFGVPVVIMSEKGSKVSFSVDNVAAKRFEYENPADMLEKLGAALSSL